MFDPHLRQTILVATPWLDKNHVVFGKVVEGMEYVRAAEALGSPSGKPMGTVTIKDSGVV